jgi:hypothetical protein
MWHSLDNAPAFYKPFKVHCMFLHGSGGIPKPYMLEDSRIPGVPKTSFS